MGASFGQNFVRAEWSALRHWINSNKELVIGATPEGAANMHRFEFPNTPLLLLGEERKGLTQRQRELCSEFISIPMTEGIDSLNMGVAGSLLMYEIYRSKE